MKFTVDTEPFGRMLEMLDQAQSGRPRRFAPVRLDAARGRLRVHQGELAAEIEAGVWQDGRCAASFAKLREAVKASGNGRRLSVQLEEDRLRVGESLIACIADCPPMKAPFSSRIFFAGDLGVISSGLPEVSFATA